MFTITNVLKIGPVGTISDRRLASKANIPSSYPVQEDDVVVVWDRSTHREVLLMKGGILQSVVTTMSLAALGTAANAVENRFAALTIDGWAGRKVDSVSAVIDLKKVVRGAAFTHGTFAGGTVVGDFRESAGIPVGTTELRYKYGGLEITIVVDEAGSVVAASSAHLVVVNNHRRQRSAYVVGATATTFVQNTARLVDQATPSAGKIAGVAQDNPNRVDRYQDPNGGPEEVLAVQA